MITSKEGRVRKKWTPESESASSTEKRSYWEEGCCMCVYYETRSWTRSIPVSPFTSRSLWWWTCVTWAVMVVGLERREWASHANQEHRSERVMG
jgi:hypothetical protein